MTYYTQMLSTIQMGSKLTVTLKDTITRFAPRSVQTVFNLNPVLARMSVVKEGFRRVRVHVAQLAEPPAPRNHLPVGLPLALRNAVGKNSSFLRRQPADSRLYWFGLYGFWYG